MGGERWMADPDALNNAIQPEVDKNIDKLRAAQADQRHLFVWISTANVSLGFTLQSIVETDTVPSTPFELPKGLDVLWVARAAISADGRPIIKSAGSGWEVVASKANRPAPQEGAG